jgi:hypothetical protein
MGELKLPTNVLSIGAARASKGDIAPEARAVAYRPGGMEPPLPLTPERLELIKACAANSLRHALAPSASQMAQRFAPRAQGLPQAGDPRPRPAGPTPLAPPLFALASGIRTLAAVLILVAVLPNLILGAIFWLRLSGVPGSQPEARQPAEGPTPALHASIAIPVLSTPAMLETREGETVAFPLALDGTDGVPAGSVIVIRDMPPGSALSAGRRAAETEWMLEPDEIGDLQLSLQGGAPSEAKLTIQLLAPNNGILADSATTLRVAAVAKAAIADSGDFVPPQIAVPDPMLETASIEQGQAEPDAAMPMAEAVPLPDRRPSPNAGDDGRAGWVRPSAYVNLRKSPSSRAPVEGVVAKGARLRVTARKRGWVQVTNPATAESGWIYSGNVEAAP